LQRTFGAIAIFAGWLSFVGGAMAGLFSSDLLGLAHNEGIAPPLAVHGISAAMIVWLFIFAAFLASFPLAYAIFAQDPRRRLRVIAVAMTICGLGLAIDPLGRSFGLPLVAGAVCLVIGGELVYREAAASDTAADTAAVATEPYAESLARAPMTTEPYAEPQAGAPMTTEAFEPPTAVSVDAAPKARPRAVGKRGHQASPKTICPWCSADVPADAQTCTTCLATLKEADAVALPIPGVTEVQPTLRKYLEDSRAGKKKVGVLQTVFGKSDSSAPVSNVAPSDESALRPPSAEIKLEMARLDLEILERQAGLPETPGEPEPSAPPAQ
jgi:hypothetical protein